MSLTTMIILGALVWCAVAVVAAYGLAWLIQENDL